MKILNDRYFSELCSHKMKGHSFVTLKNSPLSNFFMKPNALMADSIVRFAIKARTNTLMTASLAAHRNSQVSNRCIRCGQIETLNHILNGCKRIRQKYTKRHDEVIKVLCKYLTEKKRVIVHCNQCVRGRSSEQITGDNSSLKPDVWWWDGDQLMIAEFTIPYGMVSGEDNESTLSIRRREKINKYEKLIEDWTEIGQFCLQRMQNSIRRSFIPKLLSILTQFRRFHSIFVRFLVLLLFLVCLRSLTR